MFNSNILEESSLLTYRNLSKDRNECNMLIPTDSPRLLGCLLSLRCVYVLTLALSAWEIKENCCPLCSRLDYIIRMLEDNKEHIAMSFTNPWDTLRWEMNGL